MCPFRTVFHSTPAAYYSTQQSSWLANRATLNTMYSNVSGDSYTSGKRSNGDARNAALNKD